MYKLKILISLFIIFSCQQIFSAENHIKAGCKIFNNNAELLRDLGGEFCFFFDDGSYLTVSSRDFSAIKFQPNGEIAWKNAVFFHHQGAISYDQKHIYLMSKATHDFFGVKVLFDTLICIENSTGKVLWTFDLFNHLDKMRVSSRELLKKDFLFYKVHTSSYAFGHLNSVQEIKFEKLEFVHPSLKKGNLILNVGYNNTVLILNPKTHLIENLITLPRNYFENIFHDVKILETGELLIYTNFFKPNQETVARTAAVKVNWINLKPEQFKIIEIPLKVKNNHFIQDVTGGIEIDKNGNMLASTFSEEFGFQLTLYNPDLSERIRFTPFENTIKMGQVFQEGRWENLDLFLKNNKSIHNL